MHSPLHGSWSRGRRSYRCPWRRNLSPESTLMRPSYNPLNGGAPPRRGGGPTLGKERIRQGTEVDDDPRARPTRG